MNEWNDVINLSKNYKGSCRVIAFCKTREKLLLLIEIARWTLIPRQTCQITLLLDLVMPFAA